jgi:hypothetical protein
MTTWLAYAIWIVEQLDGAAWQQLGSALGPAGFDQEALQLGVAGCPAQLQALLDEVDQQGDDLLALLVAEWECCCCHFDPSCA